MAQTDVGRRIAEIKSRSGVTWDALARRLGASSGDYVRKVASGAKPGNNLRGAVDELMTAGRVQSAVPRRRTKAGELARVRAPRAAGGSIRPAETVPDPTRGYMSAGPAGSLRWSGEYAIEDMDGIRKTIRAARDARKRVSFRLHYVDMESGRDVYVQVGSKSGYDPRVVLRKIRSNAGAIAWFEEQSQGRKYVTQRRRLVLVGVEVYAL